VGEGVGNLKFYIPKFADHIGSGNIFPAEETRLGMYNLKTRTLIRKRDFKKSFIEFETFLKIGGRRGGKITD
jgi:hypothetical protein